MPESLCGGLQGSARDLGAVRSHMQLAQPDLDYLMSKSNQDRTADGLQTMGHRLAAEVAQYLQVSITFPRQVIFHSIPHSLWCGAGCDTSDILACKHRCTCSQQSPEVSCHPGCVNLMDVTLSGDHSRFC